MHQPQIVPLVICGGAGNQLVPVSRERYRVKRIVVKQGEPFVSEHWVVVRGTVRVTIGNRHGAENELIYVPIDSKHRLKNPGEIDRMHRGRLSQVVKQA